MTNFFILTRFFFYLLFYILSIISVPAICCAEVIEFVEKYHNIEVNPHDLQKIKKYEHLITYFTGFAYFKPHHLVSPEFIKELILAESSANPEAQSSKDARGLGQLTYATAREAASRLIQTGVNFKYIDEDRLRNLRPGDLYDPAINILLSSFLIAKYNYKFNGRIELVLTAWNAGENTDSLKNNAPAGYIETENLIGKVNGYYLYFINNK